MSIATYTLLIVEDFLADRELYRRALLTDANITYNLLEAGSVAEGLELYQSQKIDAVLLDYMLPDADGLEFLGQMSARTDRYAPPVVMLTGQGNESLAVRAMKAGAEDYLVKRDLTPELLQLTIQKAIDNSRLRRQLQQYQEHSESQLQIANQRITEIWESMTDAYTTVDRDWKIVYANQAATQVICQLTNLAPTEFLGRSHWDLFPSLAGTDVERGFRRALSERVAVHLEVWFEPTASWFEAHIYPAAEGLGIYFRDITDRKQLEVERLEAEQERDRFFNLSLDLLAIGNFDGYFERINPAFERLLGFTAAEFMARPFIEFVHPDDRESTLVRAQNLTQGEIVVDFENRCQRKDGSDVWVSWSATPFQQSNCWYGVGRDITERKRLEAERLAAEQERDRFFDLSIDLLATLDFNGYFTRLNPAWEKTLGFTRAELMARPFIEFIHPDDREQTLAAAQNLSTGDPVTSLENRYLCQDGSYRWLLWSAIPYPEQNVMYGIAHDITDRKQAEESLRESERKFTAIFNQTFELMGIVSLNGVLLDVNQAALESIEARREDIAGRYFWDTPWWHTPQLQQQLQAAIEQAGKGEFIRYEVQFPHPTGVMLTTDFSLKPVFDDAGSVWTIVAEARDITERKRAERDLRESQERLRTGIEVAGVGLARFDYETNLVALSPEAAVLYGFDPDIAFVTRQQIHATFHPDERAALEETIDRVVDPNGTGWFAQDHQVVWPSGEVRWLSVRKQVFFDRSGAVPRPSYAILAAIDISLRKQTERELAESEERLRAGIEVAGAGLARFDYATNLVALSPEAAALYGFAPDEFVVTREQIHATFHPDERAELEETIARVIDPNGTGWFAQDHRVVWPSGEVRCLSVRKQVFFDRVGNLGCPSHAILAAIDITERKQTQSELEERNRELDSFVHIVSHDLKAPLRAVSNLSHWIEEDLEGSLTPANQEQMNLLRARILRMEATIDGLLDYARIGRTEDSLEPVAIAEIIAETIDTLSPPPTFQIAIAKNLPTLNTKRLLLTQVFANLIGNAIKHHDRIDGSIHIGIAENRDLYEFAIADDGAGIHPDYHDTIFTIFQAVNPQNRSDSTGIGLAIVKKIIEAEGGTIRLESQLGRGTTFYFTWPK